MPGLELVVEDGVAKGVGAVLVLAVTFICRVDFFWPCRSGLHTLKDLSQLSMVAIVLVEDGAAGIGPDAEGVVGIGFSRALRS